MLDWSDRDAVAEYAASGAEILGNDRVVTGAAAARIRDAHRVRCPSADGQSAGYGVRWSRLRSAMAGAPWPVDDTNAGSPRSPRPFLPIANGDALAREINGSRLLVLEHASTAIPDAASEEVATAMLELEIQAHNCHGFPIDHY